MPRPIRRWILIADASRARVVEVLGASGDPQTLANLVFRNDVKKAQDIMADRPGRTFDSAGKGRHAMVDSSDPVGEAERRFAASVLSEIESHASDDAFDRFVVVAPPSMLHHLRREMPQRLAERLEREIDKDLTHVPTDGLVKALGSEVFPLH
ncbi:MAG: host attachment protein [Rhodobiaceae bacterium]|nr:host attachment protein [Rhodobiaceae bacterium]MCC0015647.1 host attachment protein [Rhodobiaceae bacterium]MCC0042543.1 host attachment protein [Rhodobiaceae bacterium]